MSETILTGPFYITPASDINIFDNETHLQTGGGYVGATGELPGYATVNTVNAPNLPIITQIGSFIQNNLLLVIGIGAILLLSGGRRR